MQDTVKVVKKRRSMKLTPEERKLLKKLDRRFDRQEDVATALGVKLTSYLRIRDLGRGSENNISIIREKLKLVA